MPQSDAPLPRTMDLLNRGIDKGLHIGAQLYVSRQGQILADVAHGQSRPGVPMRPDTLMLWLSSTKPIAAVAIAQHWEAAQLDLDDPVAKHIPEFGANGKESVTLRHLLTHTGGFRAILGNWEDQPWDLVIRALSDARLEPGWTPSQKAGYHIGTSWYILGEVVRRLDGRPFERYVREAIFKPLGMNDAWIGLPPEQYRAYGDRMGQMQNTSGPQPSADHELNTEAGAAQCRPGSNGRGPIRELGRFYEMMLNKGELDGVRLLSPQTAEALVAGHRIGMYDHTFRHVIDWGLGFIRNSNQYGAETVPYGYGLHASGRTFGHSGSQSSCAFADPEHNLVVAWVCNGMPGEARHAARQRAINTEIYQDLGLAARLRRSE